MKVLIADDDATIRLLLKKLVIKWGYDPVLAEDGNKAWMLLQEKDAPQLAIVDWMMPGLTGIEICQKVRSLDQTKACYIIILTAGHSEMGAVVNALNSGADDFVIKQSEPHELRARLSAGERIIKLQTELAHRIVQLEKALKDVKSLSGMLPICAWCKKIRKDDGYWQNVESYITDHSELDFSHGICPDCLSKHFPRAVNRSEK